MYIIPCSSLKRRRMKTSCGKRVVLIPLSLLISTLLTSTSTNTFVQSLSSVTVAPAKARITRNPATKDQINRIHSNPTLLTNDDDHLLRQNPISLPKIIVRSPHSLAYDTLHSTPTTRNVDIIVEELDNEDDEDEEDYDDLIRDGLNNYHSLLHTTGSEIVEDNLLHHQIQERSSSKDMKSSEAQFIQQYDISANEMEILAMNTITEQLPYPIVRTLEKPRRSTATKSSAETNVVKTRVSKNVKLDGTPRYVYNENLNFAVNGRVSVEEEIYLAQMIQMGVKLQEVKQELQEQAGNTEISRTEWAKAVQMTPKELRQALLAIRKAKHQLVTANIGLVHTVVKQQFGTNAKAVGISMEELVQEGSIGLLRAAELFNPDRGVRFSTYAVTWIKGVLLNSHVTELVRVPSREKTKYNKIKKAQSDLIKSTLGGTNVSSTEKKTKTGQRTTNANVEELALMTGLTVKDVIETQRRMDHISNIYSLDYEQKMHSRSGSDSSTMESTLTKQTSKMRDDDDLMEQMQLQTDVIAAMARNLDAREARLMRLRYGLSSYSDDDDHVDSSLMSSGGRTLQECADAMGLSYSRVHQLNERCMKKLREAAEAQSLEEYLLTIA